MAHPGQPPSPGPDEIVLSAPAPGEVCSSLAHRRVGLPAQVVGTLGQLGTAHRYREALWMQSWHKSYPMCGLCWQATRQVAQARRPGLVITDTTLPQPGKQAPRAAGRRAPVPLAAWGQAP